MTRTDRRACKRRCISVAVDRVVRLHVCAHHRVPSLSRARCLSCEVPSRWKAASRDKSTPWHARYATEFSARGTAVEALGAFGARPRSSPMVTLAVSCNLAFTPTGARPQTHARHGGSARGRMGRGVRHFLLPAPAGRNRECSHQGLGHRTPFHTASGAMGQ